MLKKQREMIFSFHASTSFINFYRLESIKRRHCVSFIEMQACFFSAKEGPKIELSIWQQQQSDLLRRKNMTKSLGSLLVSYKVRSIASSPSTSYGTSNVDRRLGSGLRSQYVRDHDSIRARLGRAIIPFLRKYSRLTSRPPSF